MLVKHSPIDINLSWLSTRDIYTNKKNFIDELFDDRYLTRRFFDKISSIIFSMISILKNKISIVY